MSSKANHLTEKLQKVLARAGLGSRREMEQWILAGRVQVNGKPASTGMRVDAKSRIMVDGKPITLLQPSALTRIITYHKPIGKICTRHDPQRRPTVYDDLPLLPEGHGRWISVGRLDINTSGLLLFTNNGALAQRLMHPRFAIEREYAVRILGKPTADTLHNLTHGVQLEDGEARFEHVTSRQSGDSANRWFYVVVVQGRNRLVRRLWESQGHKVSRLIRVRFGSILLAELGYGKWRECQDKWLLSLLDR